MIEGPSFAAARMQDLLPLMNFIDAQCKQANIPDDAAFAIRLAVEEVFTNIVQHGYGSTPGPVRCSMRVEPGVVSVTFVDEAPTFDPGGVAPPDLEADLQTRAEGGLGWHLIHQLVDEVRHQPGAGSGNTITLIKRLPHPTAAAGTEMQA